MPSNAPPPLPRRRRRPTLASPLSSSKPAFPLARRSVACRHIASCTAAVHSNPKLAPCTPQLDVQRRTLPTHIPARLDVRLITDGAALSRPSRLSPRDFPAIPPMHDAPASKIVCSRCRRLTRMRAMGDAPPTALPAPPHVRPPLFSHAPNPIAHGHSLKG
ncbi:hypothetical protein B0H14DRAFT_3013424 [Mycena olivaceomarginata]|nr:hypothetical protein B0H14DRAFT_3013424 [Mycena olivaceomarginata]